LTRLAKTSAHSRASTKSSASTIAAPNAARTRSDSAAVQDATGIFFTGPMADASMDVVRRDAQAIQVGELAAKRSGEFANGFYT
jgi:hypothetical protein